MSFPTGRCSWCPREERLYVYWCPRCKVQTERPWHIARRGNPLIPQSDEEHNCERVEVVLSDALDAERERAEKAEGEVERLRAALRTIRRSFP